MILRHLKKIKHFKLKTSHTTFCLIYTALVYGIYNGINLDKLVKWFYFKDHLDYFGLSTFLLIGFCISVMLFFLLFCRKTIKPFAILFIILGSSATYFISKYSVAIDRTMLMNTFNTDYREVHSLLSFGMIPYILFLTILPVSLVLITEITFKERYFLSSLKFCAIFLLVATISLYTSFSSQLRAANISKKYIIHSLFPINYIQSLGSIIQHTAAKYVTRSAKKIEVSAKLTAKEDIVVVLAIGETSRQKNFSLYGYKKNTNPILSQDKNLHILNGIANIGSTLYALPEILVKDDVPLTAVTHKANVDTACYANYTLYDNCVIPGEIRVSNCGHNNNCYDEDVVPLLSNNLKSYKSGQRFIVLHIGGGSHGPSYHERYPQEFQQFKPLCLDADVINNCNEEELYNAYDNTILYVDYVLGKIIKELDNSKVPYVFIYLSDHGESLMEDGRIFHGMPPGVKLPPEQAQIPLIVKSSIPITIEKRQEYSQKDMFDTVLDLLSVQTDVSDKKRSFVKKQQ